METATEEILRSRWKQLSVTPEFFEGRKKEAITYIWAASHERRLYCLQCESIEFQTEKGERIWTTTGDGEMDALPPRVGVYVVRGKSIVT
ncbi:hypothetical protein AFCA_012203 [Aspergillus flavus]|nr:hypothetical protein AFCA_012203 [Aspergillus flavus]